MTSSSFNPHTILVVNALNGSLPLVLRETYPSAKITCVEVFPFFKDHLSRMGFDVIDWNKVTGMKFDLVIGNPPYNSSDTSRDANHHRGQGDNLAKKFTLQALELSKQHMVFVLPYGHRTYSPVLAETFRQNGLYKITSCKQWFETVDTNPCVFWFDRQRVVALVDDQYNSHNLKIPDKNIGQIFRNQPGRLNRVDYEHLLQDKGSWKVVVTTSVIKYTDDQNIVEGMQDNTRGSWRVVFNCTTSKQKLGKIIVVDPDAILSKSVHCLLMSDQTSAEKMKDYLETESVQKILAQVKTINACNSKKFLEFIPMPST